MSRTEEPQSAVESHHSDENQRPRRTTGPLILIVPVTLAFLILIAAWTTFIIIARDHQVEKIEISPEDTYKEVPPSLQPEKDQAN